MKKSVIAGIIVLLVVWLWLCQAIIATGFNLKNIFIIVASGIIIFVPIWKKYIRNSDK